MKNTLIYLGGLCTAATAAPYYLPTPPGGGLTPYDWQPTYRLEGLYAIGASHTPDTGGFRLGLHLYNNGESDIRHEFGICAAPQWGSGHRRRHDQRHKQQLFQAPLTLGYTLNIRLFENLFLTLGGKGGWAWGHYREHAATYRESGSYNGFSFTAGAGLKIQCSERIYAQAGYEFGRTYTNTRHNDNWSQHIISAGIGWRF